MKKLGIIILLTILVSLNVPSYGADKTIVFEKAHEYTSEQLFEKALELVARYRFLLELEVIGESNDNKPIYVIRMTYNIYNTHERDYVNKSHILVDGGVHARETFNPVAVLKMIEDYVLDYYDDKHLIGYNVKTLLDTSMLHFIPIGNPDGFDIAKYGVTTIRNTQLRERLIELIPKLRNNRLKANINGVDINRNFQDIYYDVALESWVNQWGGNAMYSDVEVPGEDYFKGYEYGSEPETQAMMQYMARYDFRAYLTFHSMGQVIYYWMDHLGQAFYELNSKYAELVGKVTGYQLMMPDKYKEYGYSTHFFSNLTMKPSMTVETTSTFDFPTPLEYYAHDYYDHKLWAVPLAVLQEVKRTGYFEHKVYVNDRYVRDYMDKSYAEAVAKEYGGVVYSYDGPPSLTISRQIGVKVNNRFILTQNLKSADGQIYVSFRELFDLLAYEITWIGETGKAVASTGDERVEIDLNTYEGAWIKQTAERMKIEPKPILVNGRLMVPLEFVMAFLDIDLEQLTFIDRGLLVFKDL